MQRNRVTRGIADRLPTLPRASLRTLLRSRAVGAVLIATAAVQGLTIAARHDEQQKPAAHAGITASPELARRAATASASAPDPGTVAPDTTEGTLSARLAAAYRAKGYNVPDGLASAIVRAALGNGIDPALAFGLVATESEFKPTARSPVGAIGLAQLMPATARLLRPGTTAADLRQPEINLPLGFRFLRDMIDRYGGDTELALLAYNRGPTIVDRILERGGDPDNGYADKVLGRE